MTKLLLIAGLLFGIGACDGTPPSAPDAACDVVPIATVQGCTSQPLPLNAFAYPVDATLLTLYVDGTPLPASAWTLTNQAHNVTLNAAACIPDSGARLVSASIGCAVEHADCSAAYGCR